MTSLITAVGEGLRIPGNRIARGVLRPPPSKSLTQRALNLTLLSGREAIIEQPLASADTELFVAALETLGWTSFRSEGHLALRPGKLPDSAEIWCGNNGTMMRFLTAALAAVPGKWFLDGTERLRQRTVAPLVGVLRGLGAQIRHVAADGFAPLQIDSVGLGGGSVELDARLSSQFASALLMAGARARKPITIQLKNTVSRPYLDLTLETLIAFGADVEGDVEAMWYRIDPCDLKPGSFRVEADFSAAAYGAAAAVLTGGAVVLEGLRPSSLQGDRRFLQVLETMGARVRWLDAGVEVSAGEKLTGVELDLADMPDQVPTLAALAPFAHGTTMIVNVDHLRIKESNRLVAMVGELNRLGATAREIQHGLEIEGSWFDRSPPTEETKVETHGDHRIAMSLAICGLRRPGVVIGTPEVVIKSYPEFWEHLESLLEV